ncbi:PEP-CTERM sorting domain-containing protein [Adhaeretor mobilis]|uniref:PEP-CTERM motif protein n=1 Tax=Adhaeretor mobilis TaxID=1930276 RepID=A0A517MQS9_9BACT|nr:PEP-CTERM sorting domain-containing protein [Adhaeretor mobilis]QDS97240.1 PEP-CTERM motif protein [Adhaeretor mobilis]
MTVKNIVSCCVAASMLLAASSTYATELYRDNLESGVSWGINSSSADVAATFGFDYGAAGVAIPEAPNTRVGDAPTTGLKAEANLAVAGADEFTVYPIGQNFTGNYELRFDAWMNFDLENYYNNGQAGTTEFMGGGLGYDNTGTSVGSGAQVLATGDGGSGSDWRAFADGAFLSTSDMVAGTRNGFDPYYSDFLPSMLPPAGQAQTYVGPEGGIAGSPGFQWITFEIKSANGKARVTIEKPGGDRLHLTSINAPGDAPFTSDGNISLTYTDFFSSISSAPDMQFGIFDNVEVNSIPEPSSVLLLGLAGLGLVARRRRNV